MCYRLLTPPGTPTLPSSRGESQPTSGPQKSSLGRPMSNNNGSRVCFCNNFHFPSFHTHNHWDAHSFVSALLIRSILSEAFTSDCSDKILDVNVKWKRIGFCGVKASLVCYVYYLLGAACVYA